jgi:hypothetical protein
MSSNDRPMTIEDGLLFAEEPEPKPGFMDFRFGGLDENGQPIPDEDPDGRFVDDGKPE